jgi:acyl-CoA thioesterase FadM
VNNAKVVTYLELGRMKFFADVLGAERVEDIRFILAEVSCRYRIPILLHDRVFVRMHITDVYRSSFRFRCDLYDPRDSRVFVEAETIQVMYDYRTGRPVPMDADLLSRARGYIGG